MRKYYINGNTNESDAFSFEQLKANGLKATDSVWFEGLDAWKPVFEIEELIPLIKKALVPPPFPSKPTPPPFEPQNALPLQNQSAAITTPPPFQNPSNAEKSGANLSNNIRFAYQLARKRDRFWGDLICTIIYAIVSFIISYIQDPTNFITEDSIGGKTTSFSDLISFIVITAVFGAVFYPMWSGHIGHKIMGTKVISAKDGSDVNKAGAGALREITKSLFSFVIIPIIWLLWDKNKQNLYDKVVETYVVKNN